MKILLTGGSGMVGRNLLDTAPGTIWAPSSKELNLLSFSNVSHALKEFQPDLIIHAAGRVGGIAANMAAPYEFLFENLEMGKNLIAAAKELPSVKFLNFSSSCVYPRLGVNPLKEEAILTGELEPTNEGYALAKLSVMRLGEFASKNTSLNFKSLIPCNLYGRYDHFDPIKSHLLPSIMMKVHKAKTENQETIEIWGTGTVRREFMFATDLAQITWDCVKIFDQLPSSMNIGLGHDFSILEYYQTAARVLGFTGDYEFNTSKPEGMKQKLVDNTRMRNLGLRAKTSLEDGIKQTFDFYLSTLES